MADECCACLTIKWRTDEEPPGHHSNCRWECLTCGRRFTPADEAYRQGFAQGELHGLGLATENAYRAGLEERGCPFCALDMPLSEDGLWHFFDGPGDVPCIKQWLGRSGQQTTKQGDQK